MEEAFYNVLKHCTYRREYCHCRAKVFRTVMQSNGYDVFISYSHEDEYTADGLQASLQRFARPWYLRRSMRVFRDTSDLAAEPSLWSAVTAALDRSRYLVLIASRSSAKSVWVDRELRHWLSSTLHSPESIIIVQADGTIRWNPDAADFDWTTTDILPPALRGVYPSEPLHLDVRQSRALTLGDTSFRRVVAQVAARIRNVSLDQILGDDLRRHRQAKLVAAGTTLVVLFATGGGAMAYRRSITEQRAKEFEASVGLSRRLAAQSGDALSRRDARVALLTSAAALRVAHTREANAASLSALTSTQHLFADIAVSNVPVDAVALVPDRGTLLTGDAHGNVAFWSVAEGVRRAIYLGVHPQGVTDIIVSSDGRLAASGGADGGFVVWDVARRAPIDSVDAVPGFSLAFTANGKWLLAGGHDGRVSAWHVGRDRTLITRAYPGDGTIVDIAVDSSGNRFATAGLFGVVRIWDFPDLRSRRSILADPSTGTTIDFSRDGKSLAIGGGRVALLWEVDENTVYGDPYVSTSGQVAGVRFTGGLHEPVVLAVGADLYLWDGDLHRIGFHASEIHDLEVDHARRFIVTGSLDGRARIWSLVPSNQFVSSFELPTGLAAHALAFSNDGTRLAVGAADARQPLMGERTSSRGVIYVVDAASGRQIGAPLEGHRGTIVALAFSSSDQIASASDDGSIRLWNVHTRLARVVASNEKLAPDFALSPDGHLLAFVQGGKEVRVWDLDRNALASRSVAEDAVSVAFSPDGKFVAVGTAKGEVRLRLVVGHEWEVLLPSSPTRGSIRQLTFQQDGGTVVALAGGGPLTVGLSMRARASPEPLGESAQVRSLAVGPMFAAFLETNDRLTLWDLRSREKIGELNAGRDAFFPLPQQVAISGDGSHVAATLGGRVMIFHLGNAAIRARACTLASGPPTRAEWAKIAPAGGRLLPCAKTDTR